MHIRPATLADCSQTSSLSVTSYNDDELFAWMNPRRKEYPDHWRYFFLRRQQMRYWSPEQVFYVAVTDEQDNDWSGQSQVTGYAIWARRGDTKAATSWRKQSLRSRLETQLLAWTDWYCDLIRADKSADYEARDRFRATAPERFNDISDMWELQNLATDPAFQRRGVGRMLIDWGQEQATLEGCPIGLTSSMVGELLYRKKGFRPYGAIPCEGFQDIPMFIWEPEGMEGWWGMQNDGKVKGKPQDEHTEEAF